MKATSIHDSTCIKRRYLTRSQTEISQQYTSEIFIQSSDVSVSLDESELLVLEDEEVDDEDEESELLESLFELYEDDDEDDEVLGLDFLDFLRFDS